MCELTSTANEATRVLYKNKDVVSAGSTRSLERGAMPDLCQACVWSGGRPAVSYVSCCCVLGSIIGLANAVFSVSTTKWWGQVEKTCLPTGRDSIIR